MATIVIAEDDVKQAELLRLYLVREGFDVTVTHDGTEALAAIRTEQPDLVILDVMMPGLGGHDVLRVVRHDSQVPVIFVTARSSEEDLLQGLSLGADDYVTKPYSPRELVARVRTRLRVNAASASDQHEVTTHGRLRVDRRAHAASVDGVALDLTPKEFAVLRALADDPGRAFSRSRLLDHAFGPSYEGLERTVDVHIMNLRRKIEHDPSEPTLILTVRGRGYSLSDG